MIDHLNAYVLIVKDLPKCLAFYRDQIGFKVDYLDDNFGYLVFGPKGSPGLGLVTATGIAPELTDARQAVAMGGWSRSYHAVFLDDADRVHDELRAKGVHIVTPPTTRPNGQRFFFFADPEGNLWEISHFPKK